jgi:hypothetical protein
MPNEASYLTITVDKTHIIRNCCPNHPREDVGSFLRLVQAVRGIFFDSPDGSSELD